MTYQIGDKVVTPHDDVGEVISVTASHAYPIAVQFPGGAVIHFTRDGSISTIDVQQDLRLVH